MKRITVLVIAVTALTASFSWMLLASSGGSPNAPTNNLAVDRAAGVATPVSQTMARTRQTKARANPGPLVAATQEARGSFTTRSGGRVEVLVGDPSPGVLDVLPKTGDPAIDSRVRTCVWTRGDDFSAVGCREKPLFGRSAVKFSEIAAGGPDAAKQTESFISGVAAPNVTRVEAITSEREALRARLSVDRAFFVELSRAHLARDVVVNHLRVYGLSGSVIEEIDLQRG